MLDYFYAVAEDSDLYHIARPNLQFQRSLVRWIVDDCLRKGQLEGMVGEIPDLILDFYVVDKITVANLLRRPTNI